MLSIWSELLQIIITNDLRAVSDRGDQIFLQSIISNQLLCRPIVVEIL
jgi:hypothetical protein